MGCRALELVDEPHCLQVACPHPCCWETERRVVSGTQRYVKAGARAGPGERSREERPTLSVVNACEWVEPRHPPRSGVLRKGALRGHSLPDTPAQGPSAAAAGSPKITSGPQSAVAVDKKDCKAAKLSQAQIGPLHSRREPSSVMMWVPNPQYSPHPSPQHRPKTPHVAIAQLSYSLLPQLTVTPGMDKKKSKAGRQKVRFQLHSSPDASFRGSGGAALDGAGVNGLAKDSASPGEVGGASKPVWENQQTAATAKARREFVENKTAVFHSVRDWRLRASPPQHASAPQNKPGSKKPRGSADRQSNPWNRYNASGGHPRERPAVPARVALGNGTPKASQGPSGERREHPPGHSPQRSIAARAEAVTSRPNAAFGLS
ncbi:uncharacterized protein LOC108938059 [Scleropages formosus]|uniref:uncharacterized protein LOC108938059 n=1 Tax=Scleropages formosus TaxID=113540 RepID=UPI0010FA77A6|nr:uncharacterized protein LOC108938059 [Scleropages formosus]